MFTGIIKKVATVQGVSRKNENLLVTIKRPTTWKITLGQSIAINGVCSTVKKLDKKSFTVEYMPETIKKTTVKLFKPGTLINLEHSLKISDLLDGHLVQGHIDTTGRLIEIKAAGDSKVLKIKVPIKFMKLIAEKGSISVDGISLTVVDTGKDWFTVSLVSYTIDNTNLKNIKKGELVNIETDMLAKYVYKILRDSR